jgi:hypothetical protein
MSFDLSAFGRNYYSMVHVIFLLVVVSYSLFSNHRSGPLILIIQNFAVVVTY